MKFKVMELLKSKKFIKVKQATEKLALDVSFWTFSKSLVDLAGLAGADTDDDSTANTVNNYIQLGAISILFVTTTATFVENVIEYFNIKKGKVGETKSESSDQERSGTDLKSPLILNETKVAKSGAHPGHHIGNALLKTIGLSVADYITLNIIINGEDPEPPLLYTAFTVFSFVLGHKTYMACKYGDRIDVIALGGMGASTLTAIATTAKGSSLGTMIALTEGALAGFGLFCNEVRKPIEQSTTSHTPTSI